MANILEYLDWRGDIPIAVDGFNPVDNLILAQMAYTDFEGVMAEGESLGIKQAAEKYFELHTEEEVMKRTTFYKLAPIVLKKAAESGRFGNLVLENYVNIVNTEKDEQYSAITYRMPDNMIYVAFRGTDNTLVGWKEDFNLSFMSETAGQKRAVKYVNKNFTEGDETLIFGGHSKGGNLAVYAAAFCEDSIRARIKQVYSNDGPGFREEILDKPGYQEILPRIISILPEESIVGMLLENEYENRIIKSSAKFVTQHDPMTWQVYGRDFVGADKISSNSRIIDKTMMKWLATMSDEDRRAFTDSLFSSIDSTGVKTLNEISEGGVKIISDLIKAFKDMEPAKQQEFSELVKRLIKIGNDVMIHDFKKKIEPLKRLPANTVMKLTKADDKQKAEQKAEETPEEDKQ